jgi:hypothetical protein
MALITRDYSGEVIGHLGRAYLKVYMAHNKSFGRDAMSLPEFLAQCARHWHHFKIAADIVDIPVHFV